MFYRKPEWSKTYPTTCLYCGADVFFYTNSFGSKVFFDELGDPWPLHYCGGFADKEDDFYDIHERPHREINNYNDQDIVAITEDLTRELESNATPEGYFAGQGYKLENEYPINSNKKVFVAKKSKETRRVYPLLKRVHDFGVIRNIQNNVDLFKNLKIEDNVINNATLPKKWQRTKLTKITVVTNDIFGKYYRSYTGFVESNKVSKKLLNKLVEFNVIGQSVSFDEIVWDFTTIELV